MALDIKGYLLAGLQKVAAHTWYSCVHRDDDEETTLADEMDTALKGFVGVSKSSGDSSTYVLNFTRADGSSSTAEGTKSHGFSMASHTLAGMMSSADKKKLDQLPSAGNIPDIGIVVGDVTAAAGNSIITLTLWTPEEENLQQVQLPAATQSTAGVMTAEDKANLDALTNEARKNFLQLFTEGIVVDMTSSENVTIPLAGQTYSDQKLELRLVRSISGSPDWCDVTLEDKDGGTDIDGEVMDANVCDFSLSNSEVGTLTLHRYEPVIVRVRIKYNA